MPTAENQRNQFDGRLKRIQKGGANTMRQIYIGPAGAGVDPARQRPHFGLFATIVAFILGALAFLLGSLVQFHVLAEDGLLPAGQFGATAEMMAAMLGDVMIAAVALFVLIKMCRLKGLGPVLVGAIGLFAMMGGHSLSVGSAPQIYATLYSADYVEQHLARQRMLFP